MTETITEVLKICDRHADRLQGDGRVTISFAFFCE